MARDRWMARCAGERARSERRANEPRGAAAAVLLLFAAASPADSSSSSMMADADAVAPLATPTEACGQCGATNVKLSRCARCNTQRYVARQPWRGGGAAYPPTTATARGRTSSRTGPCTSRTARSLVQQPPLRPPPNPKVSRPPRRLPKQLKLTKTTTMPTTTTTTTTTTSWTTTT